MAVGRALFGALEERTASVPAQAAMAEEPARS